MISEGAWRRRFRAARTTLPGWARDDPERLIYTSNAGGKWELYAWDRRTETHRQVTDRPAGTLRGQLDPEGRQIFWFDDDRGSEFGRWAVQPFEGGTGELVAPEIGPAYSAGLAVARSFVVLGTSTEAGNAIHLARHGEPAELLYAHRESAWVSGLSRDETLLCISHSEHGDSRHPALRIVDLTARAVAELWDGPGRGLWAAGWSRVPGDQRLLVQHERQDMPRPLIWDVRHGEVIELGLDLPGEVAASWYPDGSALLLEHDYRGRSELYRYDLASGALDRIPVERGTITEARVRPDGEIWYAWTESSTPPEVRADGRVLLRPPGDPAPGGVAYADHVVDGIHIFVAEPPDSRPHPTIFEIHGGPPAHDRAAFSPLVQAWVDHGFAVVLVNYRGSTGYGKTWRDALEGDPGFTELGDIAKVHDWVIRAAPGDQGTYLKGAQSSKLSKIRSVFRP